MTVTRGVGRGARCDLCLLESSSGRDSGVIQAIDAGLYHAGRRPAWGCRRARAVQAYPSYPETRPSPSPPPKPVPGTPTPRDTCGTLGVALSRKTGCRLTLCRRCSARGPTRDTAGGQPAVDPVDPVDQSRPARQSMHQADPARAEGTRAIRDLVLDVARAEHRLDLRRPVLLPQPVRDPALPVPKTLLATRQLFCSLGALTRNAPSDRFADHPFVRVSKGISSVFLPFLCGRGPASRLVRA